MSPKIKWKLFWSSFLIGSAILVLSGIYIFDQTKKDLHSQQQENIISESQLTHLLAQQEKTIVSTVIIAIFLVLVISFIASILLARRITAPLKNIQEAAQEISQGSFKNKVSAKSRDEIAELAEDFNLMSHKLENKLSQLTNEKRELASILSNMKEGVLALNPKGRILLANQAMTQIFQLKEDIVGDFYYEVLRVPELRELIYLGLRNRASQTRELTLGFPSEKILLTEVLPIPSQNEQQISTILVFFDITQLKKLERIRKDFVANVSHELRTPLTSIKGYVEALQDGAIKNSKQAQHFLQVISQQTERMNRIISDLLLLSQIESVGYQLQKQSFSLKNLINEVFEELKSLAQKKSLQVILNFNLKDEEIKADKEKLEQVLINLLENALKFTPEKGKIKIDVSKNPLSGDKNQNLIQVSVSDTGIGIPSTDLPRIFERFYRVDKARSKELGGTGLGLSIVKHIVEAHGGTIWVESELNRGSTFHFTLPL